MLLLHNPYLKIFFYILIMGCAPSSLDNTVHHSKYVASRPTQQKYGHYDRYKKQSKKFYKHNRSTNDYFLINLN